jgi:hypothetical protein
VSNQVFANNMEVSCKAANGKSICAFPDVCFTPPQTPATPPGVPIPYPNTGLASDCTDGSSSVKISGQEIMLKDKSYFKKSTGDEAGCAPKKGVATSKNMGKVYFTMWSMDVKVEGENVVRMLDMTTHNHASCPANTPPMVYIDEAAVGLAKLTNCEDEAKAVEKHCKEDKGDPCPGALSGSKQRTSAWADTASTDAKGSSCAQALKCFLRPYKTDGNNSCCNGQTGHHIPPWSTTASVSGMTSQLAHSDALCVCLEGTNHSIGSHGKHHHGINYLLKKLSTGAKALFSAAKNANGHTIYSGKLGDHVKVAAAVTEDQLDCSKDCIQEQLEKQFTKKDMDKDASHNASATGGESYGQLSGADTSALDSSAKTLQAAAKTVF